MLKPESTRVPESSFSTLLVLKTSSEMRMFFLKWIGVFRVDFTDYKQVIALNNIGMSKFWTGTQCTQ